jgi:hypothetical protein
MDTVTREQATAVLDAIKAQFAKQITLTDWSGHDHADLTGHALISHLMREDVEDGHFYEQATIARRIDRGVDLVAWHAELHEPSAVYPEPVLYEPGHHSDTWTIAWEEGPDEWVHTLGGGSAEGDRVLRAQTAAEFGVDPGNLVAATTRPAAVMPAGVYVEPVNHWSVAVYPA